MSLLMSASCTPWSETGPWGIDTEDLISAHKLVISHQMTKNITK